MSSGAAAPLRMPAPVLYAFASPGRSDGSQRMVTGPVPPARSTASVAVRTRPAATSASASPASSRWAARWAARHTHAGRLPHPRDARTGVRPSAVTSPPGPPESGVNAARPARSGSRHHGSADRACPPSWTPQVPALISPASSATSWSPIQVMAKGESRPQRSAHRPPLALYYAITYQHEMYRVLVGNAVTRKTYRAGTRIRKWRRCGW